jgi:hypothetical protein
MVFAPQRVKSGTGTDTLEFMNRNKTVCVDVGKLIHRASKDQVERDKLKRDAKKMLESAGILDTRCPVVVEDDSSKYNVIIPNEVYEENDPVFENDHSRFVNYLAEIGFITIMGCK